MLLQSAEQRSKSAFNVQLPLTVLQQKSFCVISVNQILQKSYNILDIEKLLQYLISYKDIEERFCKSDIVCFHSAVNPTFFVQLPLSAHHFHSAHQPIIVLLNKIHMKYIQECNQFF